MRVQHAFILALAMMCLAPLGARAQISDDVVRIGVLNDQSGLYADLGGPGSVTAARMALEDAGGSVLGKPVEIVSPSLRATGTAQGAVQWTKQSKAAYAARSIASCAAGSSQ